VNQCFWQPDLAAGLVSGLASELASAFSYRYLDLGWGRRKRECERIGYWNKLSQKVSNVGSSKLPAQKSAFRRT
jgi:hypothetical protein